jgi:predicted TIM-barrel fold metal-dependent hydrolase
MHNDAMIQVARQLPAGFRVLATLPLASPAASVEELGRLASEATVVGFELGKNVNGGNLDHPDLTAVWRAVAAAGLVVVLHPDNVAGADRMDGYYLHNFVGNPTDTTIAAASLVFGGVLRALPRLRVVLLHWGGFVPYLIDRFGSDHVCLGSDYPFDMAARTRSGRSATLSATTPPVLEAILERTPAGLLQRSPVRPAGEHALP